MKFLVVAGFSSIALILTGCSGQDEPDRNAVAAGEPVANMAEEAGNGILADVPEVPAPAEEPAPAQVADSPPAAAPSRTQQVSRPAAAPEASEPAATPPEPAHADAAHDDHADKHDH